MTPLIVISACRSTQPDGSVWHQTREGYVEAVRDVAGGLPLLLPALGTDCDCSALIKRMDGLLLTGSPTDIEPRHYEGGRTAPDSQHDPARDATVLPLIPPAIAAGVPILAICRGFQELNVALGGTLHAELHAQPGFQDHRAARDLPREERFGPAHEVYLESGGELARWCSRDTLTVNSLHGQGIARLAPGLVVEARAPDSVIEAVRCVDARSFCIGVQWHPEWRAAELPCSRAIFERFGAACRAHAAARVRT
jgi:putative glutamine amidotransferase